MNTRVVLGALMGALMVVATGCSEECVDQFDCINSKGNAPEGQAWTCADNKCQLRSTTPPEGSDAGTQTDAGTGTDGGTGTDAGTDAGTETDAGVMTVAEGAACTSTESCMAGLFCEDSGGTKKCQPLHIAVTVAAAAGGGATDAVVVRYKNPGSEPPTGTASATKLSESTTGSSRFPRWSPDGTAVAFVQEITGNDVELERRNLPLAAGNTTPLTTGTNAGGTIDFRYMEWEPSSRIAWSTTTKTGSSESTSGIKAILGTGGTVEDVTSEGVFPSWAADGNSFVYSQNSIGLKNKVLGGAETVVTGTTNSSEQPLHNKANGVLLFLDAKGNVETLGGVSTPLTELYTLNPSATGTPAPVAVANVTSADVVSGATTGQLKSFIANHTWAPGGTHAAYVRVYYFKPTLGGATLCAGGAECQGKQGNVIFVRRIDASGTPQGEEMELASEATLPSFSPDGRFIAYLSGGKLRVQQINPEATDAASLKGTFPLITHSWTGVQSNRGDDHRPRWQPR
jgi:WD40 repeat protein